MGDMDMIAYVAEQDPAKMRAMYVDILAHIWVDQIGPHFRRCAEEMICPWAMARERVVTCDCDCGATLGCAIIRMKNGMH